mmetsp:Transcript_23555/g.69982  ORF Transcript_23555/g.69982 Transcript_23555/m.69982 type:complete len:248 (-) Transcript_23555:1399-2142(-)
MLRGRRSWCSILGAEASRHRVAMMGSPVHRALRRVQMRRSRTVRVSAERPMNQCHQWITMCRWMRSQPSKNANSGCAVVSYQQFWGVQLTEHDPSAAGCSVSLANIHFFVTTLLHCVAAGPLPDVHIEQYNTCNCAQAIMKLHHTSPIFWPPPPNVIARTGNLHGHSCGRRQKPAHPGTIKTCWHGHSCLVLSTPLDCSPPVLARCTRKWRSNSSTLGRRCTLFPWLLQCLAQRATCLARPTCSLVP